MPDPHYHEDKAFHPDRQPKLPSNDLYPGYSDVPKKPHTALSGYMSPYAYRHGTPVSPHVMWSPEEHRSFFYASFGERVAADISYASAINEEGEPHELEVSTTEPMEGYH